MSSAKLRPFRLGLKVLTHWGRVTHICVGVLTIIGSDNGLSPGRRQAITWTNAGILLIGPLGTNFSEMLIKIHTFSFKKIHLKMLSAKCRPFRLGLNVLYNISEWKQARQHWVNVFIPSYTRWSNRNESGTYNEEWFGMKNSLPIHWNLWS